MKEIKLTKEKVALVSDCDFEYLNQWKWIATEAKKGVFYATRAKPKVNGKQGRIYMHRVIMNVNDGFIMVDHVDRNTLNNTRDNLRKATRSQNRANSNTKRKYKGVSKNSHSSTWVARIMKDGKDNYIGCFKTEIEAATAYNQKAIELFGSFSNVNKVAI